jgi:predicted GTPase
MDTQLDSSATLSYEELKRFQACRKQLDTACYQLFQLIQDGSDCGLLPQILIEEVGKISRRLQSQRFRLAVVGEFSQGKSTLINALICQEIQPVRAIACSSTITVLKYGSQKQILCLYKNGCQEQISFEQYQNLVTLSKEAVCQYRSDGLAHSEIEEIIFEHPHLDLCKNGVEIVDSPGLNEHPDRAAITQKLLKDTDAIIFITDASKALTQGERNLIQSLKVQLNSGKKDQPADNLFIVVNKMDQL